MLKSAFLILVLLGFLLIGWSTSVQAAPVLTHGLTSVRVDVSTQKGVNGNPWGYNFVVASNHFIRNPPKNFCGSYFHCIKSFWQGKGYVMQCHDGLYSKSGGIRGSCSYHKGNWHILYWH
jgi:hypothetical protein